MRPSDRRGAGSSPAIHPCKTTPAQLGGSSTPPVKGRVRVRVPPLALDLLLARLSEGTEALNLGRVGSTPALAALHAGDARRAGHRPRNADEVGSSPTAGSCSLKTSDRTAPAVGCNPTSTQVRLLPASLVFRCSSGGKSVSPKRRRPLARPQPPELPDRVGVRPGAPVMGPWKRRAPRVFRFDSSSVR